MIASQMGHAQAVATRVWKKSPSVLDRDELTSIAYLALVRAADEWPRYCERHSYDPARVEYFAPYVDRRVNGAIMDELRKTDWVERSTREKIKSILEAGHGQDATQEQVQQRTGLSAKQVQKALSSLAARPVSLDAEGVEHGAEVDSSNSTELLQRFQQVVRELPKPEQTVLALHYFAGLELREVARMLGLTESRASRLHTEAVLRVHAALLAAAGG